MRYDFSPLKDGSTVVFDTSPSVCSKFGALSGQQVLFTITQSLGEGTTFGTVIGVYENQLWYFVDGSKEPLFCYGHNFINLETLEQYHESHDWKLLESEITFLQKLFPDGKEVLERYRDDKDYELIYEYPPAQIWLLKSVVQELWICEPVIEELQVSWFAVDNDNTIYAIQNDAKHILKIPQGKLPQKIVPLKSGVLSLAWDANSLLYFSTTENELMVVGMTSTQQYVKTLLKTSGSINHITVDNNGDVYFVLNHAIMKFNTKTTQMQPLTESTFKEVQSLTATKEGTLYLNSSFTIKKLKNGVPVLVSGTHNYGSHIDGKLLEAKYHYCDIKACNEGLLVVDSQKLRLVNFKKDLVTTFFKLPTVNFATANSLGTIYFSTQNGIFKLQRLWDIERLIWIGNKKELATNCHLAKLPRDIIKEVLKIWKRAHTIVHECVHLGQHSGNITHKKNFDN